MDINSILPLPGYLAYAVLALFILPVTLLLYAKPFVREAVKQAFYIAVVEKILPPRGIPRVGPNAIVDVSNAEWLTDALGVKFPQTVVESVSAKSMGSDMGNASTMFRLQVEYVSNPHNLPKTMVVKLVKNDIKNRLPFTVTRMNEMETKFYSTDLTDELREKHGIQVARGFGGKYCERGGNCFVIIEDITTAPVRASFTTEQSPINSMEAAISIVEAIGVLHGSLFNARARFATDLSWVIKQNDPVLGMTKEFFQAGWNTFIARLGDRIPNDVRERGPLLASVAQQVHDFMGLAPFTLVHGDCHLENSYFTATNQLGFYDMQLMRVAKGALDLASFMGGSFSADVLGGGPKNDDGETRLLQAYLRSLKKTAGTLLYLNEFGVEVEYDLQSLKRDYKLGLALLFVWNVAAALAVPFDTSAHLDFDEYAVRLVDTVHRTSAINYALWYLSIPGLCEKFGLRGGPPALGPFGTPSIQRNLPGYATNMAHDIQLHESKISPEEPQSFFDKYVRRALKYRLIHLMTSRRGGHHGQSTAEVSHSSLEGHHSVKFAEGTDMQNFALDSYYLSAFSSNTPSFALRWCRRYKESMGEVWLAVKMPEPNGSIWVWGDHPMTTTRCFEDGPDTVVVEGKDGSKMRFTCVEAMKTWRATFSGRLRNKVTNEIANVTFDIETDSCMPHFAFGSHVSPSLVAQSLANEPFSKELFDELKATHQEHYEQFCHVHGTFFLNGSKHVVNAKGMRDRAFGSREWGYLQRYVASYFWAGDQKSGPCFTLVYASLPTMTSGRFGFVTAKDGEEPCAVDAISGKLSELANDGIPPKEWELCFRCNGIYYLCRAFAAAEDSVGLNMQNAMWVHLRFATFEISFVDANTFEVTQMQGVGASEFGYRFQGYEPYRPKKASMAPVHAKA